MKLLLLTLTLTAASLLVPRAENHNKMSLGNINTTNTQVIASTQGGHGAWFVEAIQ